MEDSLVSELAPDTRRSYQVVIVSWPSSDNPSIGVLTSTFSRLGTDEKLAAVYVSDSLDPTKEQIRIVCEDSVVLTGWTVTEFGSIILSYGGVATDRTEFNQSLSAIAVES